MTDSPPEPMLTLAAGELPPGPWECARGAWSRTGGGVRNARRTHHRGPGLGRLDSRRRLPVPLDGHQSSAMACDGDQLWLTHGGAVAAFGVDGQERWSKRCDELLPGESRGVSAPMILVDGTGVVTAGESVAFVRPSGELMGLVRVGDYLDDSGISPTTTTDGRLLLTTPGGDVFTLAGDLSLKSWGSFGYDVVPPARFEDGSFAICGYAGSGLVRVAGPEAIRWSSDFVDADLVPSINDRGYIAAGSRNDGHSRLFSPDGELLGLYFEPAIFGCLEEDWIALGPNGVSRIDPRGEVIWLSLFDSLFGFGWGGLGPVITAGDCIYYPDPTGLCCLDPDGSVTWRLSLGSAPRAITPIAPGTLAVIADDELLIIR